VLIVGAGVAGLTLAASPERFGITAAVVEVEKACLSRGLALMLTSNVALALRRVGLERAVVDRGTVLDRITHIDPSGTPREEDHDLRGSNERYGPNLGITRDGLMSALSRALRDQIRYSTTIASLDWSAEGPEVGFSDGTQARFDLVVGADGIGSAVRQAIYPYIQPEYRSFCAWRTVMECSGCDPVFRLSTSFGCFLGSFPVAPGLVYAFLLAHSAEVPTLSRDGRLARLKELAARFHGNVSSLTSSKRTRLA
jgi:2-polyprenyl-6-methoxyphenol hydroxylase-like FAD-dependent oxidoreductase